jgi:hypothetical protein
MLRIQALRLLPDSVVVFEKTTDGTRRELPEPDPDVERWISKARSTINR